MIYKSMESKNACWLLGKRCHCYFISSAKNACGGDVLASFWKYKALMRRDHYDNWWRYVGRTSSAYLSRQVRTGDRPYFWCLVSPCTQSAQLHIKWWILESFGILPVSLTQRQRSLTPLDGACPDCRRAHWHSLFNRPTKQEICFLL